MSYSKKYAQIFFWLLMMGSAGIPGKNKKDKEGQNKGADHTSQKTMEKIGPPFETTMKKLEEDLGSPVIPPEKFFSFTVKENDNPRNKNKFFHPTLLFNPSGSQMLEIDINKKTKEENEHQKNIYKERYFQLGLYFYIDVFIRLKIMKNLCINKMIDISSYSLSDATEYEGFLIYLHFVYSQLVLSFFNANEKNDLSVISNRNFDLLKKIAQKYTKKTYSPKEFSIKNNKTHHCALEEFEETVLFMYNYLKNQIKKKSINGSDQKNFSEDFLFNPDILSDFCFNKDILEEVSLDKKQSLSPQSVWSKKIALIGFSENFFNESIQDTSFKLSTKKYVQECFYNVMKFLKNAQLSDEEIKNLFSEIDNYVTNVPFAKNSTELRTDQIKNIFQKKENIFVSKNEQIDLSESEGLSPLNENKKQKKKNCFLQINHPQRTQNASITDRHENDTQETLRDNCPPSFEKMKKGKKSQDIWLNQEEFSCKKCDENKNVIDGIKRLSIGEENQDGIKFQNDMPQNNSRDNQKINSLSKNAPEFHPDWPYRTNYYDYNENQHNHGHKIKNASKIKIVYKELKVEYYIFPGII